MAPSTIEPTSHGNGTTTTTKQVINPSTAEIIRYRDLEPQWHVPGAKEPGFMRWLISWVGGPAGYVNPSRDAAVVSNNSVVGLMSLPVGQRQKGLHYHSVTEIYVILKGELEGYDHTGTPHRAGPLDCMYIPAGVPHGVRNCGSEDCELVWVHDGIEKIGTSIYFMDGIVPADYPPQPDITIVRFADLEPSYSPFKAKEVEWMRWMISWVAGKQEEGYENFNPGIAAVSEKVGLGMTVLMPGQKSVPYTMGDAETYVVMKGKALIQFAEESKGKWREEIGRLDGVYVSPCAVRGVRNHGDEPLFLMWVQERPQKVGQVEYH